MKFIIYFKEKNRKTKRTHVKKRNVIKPISLRVRYGRQRPPEHDNHWSY